MDRRDKIDVELMSNAFWHGSLVQNAPGHFVNKMVPPLDFGYDQWDVAVSSVHYEHTWRMKSTYYVAVVLLYPIKELSNGREVYGVVEKPRGEEETRVVFELPIGPRSEMRKISVSSKDYGGKKLKMAESTCMAFTLSDDQDASIVGTEIAEKTNMFYRDQSADRFQMNTILTYEYDTKKQRSMFTSELGEVVIYMEGANTDVCRILGYHTSGVDRIPSTKTDDGLVIPDAKLIRINHALQADHPPLCPRPSSLLIYSTIANQQRCGDKNVQLLTRVPVKTKFGELSLYDFHRLNFKALAYGVHHIDDIEIQINDHAGNPVDFTSGITSISLIFRKAEKY